MKAVGLPELLRHLRGEMTLAEAVGRRAARDPPLCETPDDLVSPPVAARPGSG